MGIVEQILTIEPLILILIVSFIVTLISVVAYKLFTDQTKMKELKEGMKKHQQEMKNHRGDHKKLMQIQNQAMQKNMQYMSHSFKPMLFTFLPIILIFGWMHANLAFEPILPGQEFSVVVKPAVEFNFSTIPQSGVDVISREKANDSVVIKMKCEEGQYTMYFDSANEKKNADLIITKEQKYATPSVVFKSGEIKSVTISNGKMRPFGKEFRLFGWQPGWFAVYFFSTLIFSSLLRKIMKVY